MGSHPDALFLPHSLPPAIASKREDVFPLKKICSLLLTLAMLLSLAPAAYAAQDDAVALSTDPVVLTEDEIEVALEEEARAVRQSDADARAQAPEEIFVSDLPETAALGASNVTIRGTITLPAAYSGYADNFIRVYAVTPAVTDETGRVTQEPMFYGGRSIELDQGDTSVSYELDVPAGDYSFAIYNYADIGFPRYSYAYFNGDGTPAANDYVAVPASFPSGGTVDLTIPKAQRTISGTLTFSEPLAESIAINVYGYNQSRYYEGRVDGYLRAEKGQRSVDFSFSANPGSYFLEFTAERYSSGYADIYGGFSHNYNDRMYFNVEAESLTGLVLDGDALLEAYEGGEEEPYYEINVTVNLPEPAEQWEEYMVFLWNEDNPNEPWDYMCPSAYEGESSISTAFWVPDGTDYTISYVKCTNWRSMSWRESYPANRFLGENGTTWDRSEAKIFTCQGEDADVTFDDTNNYKITGKLLLPAAETEDLAAYVMTRSGEISFGDRVVFYAGQTETDFTVYIPTAYAGAEFTACGYKADGRTIFLNENTCATGDTFTLSGDQTVSAIPLPQAVPTVAGTFTLPAGVTAPAGGLAVRFYYNESESYYIIPGGASSVDYVLFANLNREEDGLSVNAELLNAPVSLFPNSGKWFEFEDAMDADLTADEAVLLSGTVTVPEACADGGSTFEVECDSENSYGYTYLTVLPGKTSASFAIFVPKGVPSRVYTYLRGDATGCLLSANLYLQPDGTVSTEYNDVVLTRDTTVTFPQQQGSIITGTITVPVDGAYEGRVYAQPTQGGSNYRSANFQFDGTQFTYKLAVPVDAEATYRLYLNLNDAPAGVMTGSLYYSASGTVLNYSDADQFSVPAEGFTADFVVPRSKTVTGTVTLFEGLSANNMNVNVYAWSNDKEENRYNTNVSFNGSTGEYKLNLPLEYTGTYFLGLRAYCYEEEIPEGLINETYLYLTADGGWTTNRADAAPFPVTEDGLVQDMTLPKGISTTITLNAPEGFSSYYAGNLRLVPMEDGETRTEYFNFEGDSTTIAFSALPGDTTEYILRLYLDAGDGAMTNRYYYYAGNGVWVPEREGSAPITLGSGDLEIPMPSGKVIRGKLVSADGSPLRVDAPEDLNLSLNGDSYLNYTYKFQPDGSFLITIPDDATGQYRLQVSPPHRTISNIVEASYYYAEGSTEACTDWEAATMIDVSGKIPELTVLVDTGYVLSGTVELGEGTVLTSSNSWNTSLGHVYLNLWEMDGETQISNQDSCTAYLYSEEKPWTYFFVVPKQEATYQVEISRVDCENSYDDSITSNLFVGNYWNSGMGDVGTFPVTGDTALPTVYLTNWYANTEDLLFQSRHGFFHDEIDSLPTFTYSYPVSEPQWIEVTFDPRTDVNLYVNGSYCGSPNGPQSVYVEDGTINITIDGDSYYSDQYFGFGITAIQSNEPLTDAGFGAVYTGDTYDADKVLPTLDSGDEITVSLSGPTDESASVLAAIYDDLGRMIGLRLVEVNFTNGSAKASVGFENSAAAESMKLMLLDDLLSPFTSALTYTR